MRVNHTIRTLITGDFLINSGMSLFAPVFAIFITRQIADGTIEAVGFAVAITQIIKSVFQIPVARWLDKNHGEYDDFIAMITGSVIAISVPLLYLLASSVSHIYLIQIWSGLGLAIGIPPWFAIFTRHIDDNQENIEWSFESVAIGISGAGAAALSGILVSAYGFNAVFILGAFIAFIGMLMQIRIYQDLMGHVPQRQVKPHIDRSAS